MTLNARRLVLKALVLTLSTTASVSQVIVAPLPIDGRLNQADVVCVCSPIETQVNGASPHREPAPSFLLRVFRTYKGATVGRSLKAKDQKIRFDLASGVRYLLLLRHEVGTEELLIEDAIVVPDSFPPETPQGSVEGDLDEYLSGYSDGDLSNDTESVLKLLDQYEHLSPSSVVVLQRLAKSSDPEMALFSSSMLLMRQIDVTNVFPLYLSKLKESPAIIKHREGIQAATFILTRYASSSEIPKLEELGFSTDLSVRHASLQAIRKLREPSTTPFLMRQLRASDEESQYIALITLSTIYGKSGEYGPGIGQFLKDSERYIRLWEEWYAASAART